MSLTIIGKAETKLSFAPQTLEESITQNIRMIIDNPKFSVPLNRDFGLRQDFLDKSFQVAQALLIAEIMDAVDKYEPRAIVKSVELREGERAGQYIPFIEVELIDEQ